MQDALPSCIVYPAFSGSRAVLSTARVKRRACFTQESPPFIVYLIVNTQASVLLGYEVLAVDTLELRSSGA